MGFMQGSTGLCTSFLTDARELTGGRTNGLVHKPSRAPRPWPWGYRVAAICPFGKLLSVRRISTSRAR